MNQGFWMAKVPECLNDGEMAYDNSSRIDPKRSHQWFMDGPEADLFPNKKQAVGVPNSNLFSGLLNSNVPPWANASSFHSISGPFSERLFDPATARTVNFDDRNITSVNTEKIDPGRKVSDDLFSNDSSFGLSMSQTLEDPRAGLSYGIRKVKVSQVKDTDNVMAVSMGHGYDAVDNNTIPMNLAYGKADDSSISMNLAYGKADDSSISMNHAYSKADDCSISMGLAYGKGDGNIMSMGDTFVRDNNVFVSMGQSYNKGNDNISIGQTYKENDERIQMSHTFSKGDNNIISMDQTYNKVDDSTMSRGRVYNKDDDNTISMVHSYTKDDSNSLAIGQSYNKGESTIISFGGYDVDDANSSGTLLPSYGMMTGQSSVLTSETLNQKQLVKSNVDTLVSNNRVAVSVAENNLRKKEDLKTSKKAPSNNFPSNVRSLLSTGMLDGVPVKYIAWSREKELRGVIKGSRYQCSCQSCNYSKVINAYEFERHAGCKTKHPNNHIYFENGKTIYGIVQELRSTPQNMLFDVIQTITGSAINQKSFRLWKESFLAATRELQRIYGKDEGKQLSRSSYVQM